MYVLHALKLKLWLRRKPVSKSLYSANKPYTMGLKLKSLRGRNEDFKINQGRIMTLSQQRRTCALLETAFTSFLRRIVLWVIANLSLEPFLRSF